MVSHTLPVDLTLVSLLRDLPANTAVYAVILAVIIAPWVYRWRLRVRRIMVRLAWIGLGVAIGISF
jgi:hypothetical protein